MYFARNCLAFVVQFHCHANVNIFCEKDYWLTPSELLVILPEINKIKQPSQQPVSTNSKLVCVNNTKQLLDEVEQNIVICQ